jgi:RNA-directed DNA polymerase
VPRRAGNLIDGAAAPENLRLAFWRAARGKADRPDVRAFRSNLNDRLMEICGELREDRCGFGPYSHFRVFDPKERLIAVAPFRDRVVHHCVMAACEPVFERYCIQDTYACRRGKGAQLAVGRARQYAHRHDWFLKWDIAKYFDSIPHARMMVLLERRFKDGRLLRLFERLLDSHHATPARGLPIGNLTSQHFANAYLGQLDHWLKDDKGAGSYVRYMDDMVLWGDCRQELAAWQDRVEAFVVERLDLRIKPNIQLNRCDHGMTFLGYRIYPGGIRLAPRSRRRYIRKLNGCLDAWEKGTLADDSAARRVQALAAFARFANTGAFRQAVLARRAFNDYGHGPRARTGSNAAGAGTTPPATARRATATATTRTTGTATTASGSFCPQLAKSAGARTIADPARVLFPSTGGTKTSASPGQVGAAERAGEAPFDRQSWLFEIEQPLRGDEHP